jgi:UDP-N-acetylmuramoyl-tripeptide--D-alanyl-D-alanine ligase
MSINLWNTAEVVEATGGTCGGAWEASSVSIDTRTIEVGALFVALMGERMDGHRYVAQAFEKGAVAAIVSAVPEGMSADDTRLVMVVDTERALQHLGIASRNRSTARFIGITGSVGKTGAKEMLSTALAPLGKVYATRGNLNNHLGVPLTLSNMPLDSEYAIIEMGMNHAGEILELSKWARPHLSIITTVDAVHIEFFDSVQGIADAKAEIFAGMGAQGFAVLNRDNPYYERLKSHAEKQGIDRILSFGIHKDAICRMNSYRIEEEGTRVEAMVAGTHITYKLGTIGKHWALMSVAVLGVVEAFGGDIAKSAEAYAHFHEPKGRGHIRKLAVADGYIRLIDDAYNASPVSMTGAIDKVAEMRKATREMARTVIVLGDMLELGEDSRDLHVGLVPSIVNNQIDLVFAAGSFMQHLYDALPEPMKGAYEATAASLAPRVVRALKHRDIVLVKGSHGSRMDEVVTAIEENAMIHRKEASDAL